MDYVRTSCVDPRDAGSHSGNRQCHTPGSCGSPAGIPQPGFLYPVGVSLARGEPSMEAVLSLRIYSYTEIGCAVSHGAEPERFDHRLTLRSDRVRRPEIRVSKFPAAAGFDTSQQCIYSNQFHFLDCSENEAFYLLRNNEGITDGMLRAAPRGSGDIRGRHRRCC